MCTAEVPDETAPEAVAVERRKRPVLGGPSRPQRVTLRGHCDGPLQNARFRRLASSQEQRASVAAPGDWIVHSLA
jgi:hypothetical protein